MATFEDRKGEEIRLRRTLNWFREEFDTLFGSKGGPFSERDRGVAEDLMDRLSEVVNGVRGGRLLGAVVETLDEIERRYPDLFRGGPPE
jgi:hypothetical protein